MSFDVDQLDMVLLVATVVLFAAILAVRFAVGAGLPALLVYLGIGVLLGDAGPGIEFSDPHVAHALGFAALALILAEGGLRTDWEEIRPSVGKGAALATLGVGVSVAVIALVMHYLVGLDWQLAVLLGAVTSPTDAAAVFSVLRRVPLPRRITAVLESESGFNDPPTVVLVTLVSTGTALDNGISGFVGVVVYELALGVLVGLAVGFGGAWLMRRVALPGSGLYPLALLALAMFGYAAAAQLHASGFAAVYTAALVLGNSRLPHRAASRSFVEGVGWLAQIGLFIMLGLLVNPWLFTADQVVVGVVTGLVLTFLARPLSVLCCLLPFRVPLPQQAFIAWSGLRGAVPIVLATIALSVQAPQARALFDAVFVMVVIFTLLNSPTLPLVARWLGVEERAEARDVEVEAAPLERLNADLLQVNITEGSRLHGVTVDELRLPGSTSVSLLVRDGRPQVPGGQTMLRRGDQMLVVTPRRLRNRAETRIRAVSRSGRLARWVGNDDASS